MYEPEVIIGAHWLNDFGVPIIAYAVNVLTHDGHTFLSMDQRYPLPELADTYVARGRSPERVAQTEAGWSEVLNEIKLPWGRHAVSVLTRWKPGDPITRRFGSLFSDGPFGATQMNITHQHVKAYVRDPSQAQAERLRAALGPAVPIATWGSDQSQNSGHTFVLKTQQDFDRFVAAASKPREPSASGAERS